MKQTALYHNGQGYEIYLTVDGCDSEWLYLGKLQAENQADALKVAAQNWKEYPPENLVLATADVEVFTLQSLM